MKEIDNQLKQQLDEIKKMWFKNIQLIADYSLAPVGHKPMTNEQFEKLVKRTQMLKDIVDLVEGTENN